MSRWLGTVPTTGVTEDAVSIPVSEDDSDDMASLPAGPTEPAGITAATGPPQSTSSDSEHLQQQPLPAEVMRTGNTSDGASADPQQGEQDNLAVLLEAPAMQTSAKESACKGAADDVAQPEEVTPSVIGCTPYRSVIA